MTKLLVQGSTNVLGVMLGNGWFSLPGIDAGDKQFMLLLTVTTAGGTTMRFPSKALRGADGGLAFNATAGPVTYDIMATGERYDGRIAASLNCWSAPGYNASDSVEWVPAVLPAVSPRTFGSRLVSHTQVIRTDNISCPLKTETPPLSAINTAPANQTQPLASDPTKAGGHQNGGGETMPSKRKSTSTSTSRPVGRAVSITEPVPGVFVFDFGQNVAGQVTLRVRNGSNSSSSNSSSRSSNSNSVAGGSSGCAAGTVISMFHTEILYPSGEWVAE